MPEIKKFEKAYITGELEKIGSALKRKIKIFLIGGCAMSFRELKTATKDIDIVFVSPEGLKDFASALKSLGYREAVKLPDEYKNIGASTILRNKDDFQCDLFYKQVCRGLEITERMEGRSQYFKTFGNLRVRLISPEDIFLFKSMTEREGDLEDMRILATGGLDWGKIKEECLLQERRKIWEAFLVDRLEELENRFHIKAPITRELKKLAGEEMTKMVLINIIKEGTDTVDEIAKVVKEKYKYSESWTRRELKKLVDAGTIKIKREGRVNKYAISK
jgi:predicted transcriptional regulator